MTRIGEILERHLALAERQLEFASEGVDFSAQFAEGAEFLALTEDDLRRRIACLENAVASHGQSNA